MAPRSYSDYCWIIFDHFLDVLDFGARILGPLLILGAMFIICADVSLFYGIILPSIKNTTTSNAVSFIWVFSLSNLLYNYAICVLCDPGRVKGMSLRAQLAVALAYDPSYARGAASVLASARAEESSSGGGGISSSGNVSNNGSSRPVRWCEECRSPKPPRVHHCSVCRACVLKMDHRKFSCSTVSLTFYTLLTPVSYHPLPRYPLSLSDCPWVNNCVGVRTYPYFLRLLFWVLFCTFFFSLVGKNVFWTHLSQCDPAAAKLLYVSTNPSPLGLNGLLHETTRGGGVEQQQRRVLLLLNEDGSNSSDGDDNDESNEKLPSALLALRPRPAAGTLFFRSFYRRLVKPLLTLAHPAWAYPKPNTCSHPFLVFYIVTLSLAGSISLLGGFHVIIAARGLTSIEFYKAPKSTPQTKSSSFLYSCFKKSTTTSSLPLSLITTTTTTTTTAPSPPQHPFSEKTIFENYRNVFQTGCFSMRWILPPSVTTMKGGIGTEYCCGGSNNKHRGLCSCLLNRSRQRGVQRVVLPNAPPFQRQRIHHSSSNDMNGVNAV